MVKLVIINIDGQDSYFNKEADANKIYNMFKQSGHKVEKSYMTVSWKRYLELTGGKC